MAVKITTDSIVRMVRPTSYKFNLDELNNHVEGFIEPIKVGPLWVMYADKAKQEGQPLNEVASFFFNVAIYGPVMVVPPQQLPLDWDIMDPEDYRYSADDVDNGFLLSLQKALIYNRVFGDSRGEENVEDFMTRLTPSEEWTYSPPVNDEVDEKTAEFYRQVYEYISKNPEQLKKNVLLAQDHVVVKLENSDDLNKTIKQMIDYFVRLEEYEKCSFLKRVIE